MLQRRFQFQSWLPSYITLASPLGFSRALLVCTPRMGSNEKRATYAQQRKKLHAHSNQDHTQIVILDRYPRDAKGRLQKQPWTSIHSCTALYREGNRGSQSRVSAVAAPSSRSLGFFASSRSSITVANKTGPHISLEFPKRATEILRLILTFQKVKETPH